MTLRFSSRLGFAWRLLGVGWLSMLVLGAVTSAAETVSHEASGRVLLGDLNCTVCHLATKAQSAWVSTKVAPRLRGVGNRNSPEWLQQFLADPQGTIPGTTMPDVLSGLTPAERTTAAEALTHHLLSLTSGAFRRVLPDRAAVRRGEALYHRVGCVACHAPQNTSLKVPKSVPLPQMAEKWSVEGLAQFLRDPLESRPSGRMPSLRLTPGEATDIAQYLLRDTQVAAPLEVAQYRGRIQALEDLESAELLRTEAATNFSLNVLGGDRGTALRFTGWLQIPQAGAYTFHLNATGASRLSIADGWRLGEDSWQRERVAGKTTMRLDAGWTPIVVDYVPRGSKQPAFQLEWEGPGVTREPIPSARLRRLSEPVREPTRFVLDAQKAEQGRVLYSKLKCAVCHDAQAPEPSWPSLAALTSTRGCLADEPTDRTPQYSFQPDQRVALRAALDALNRTDLPEPTDAQRLSHGLRTWHCTACHVRDGVGGIGPERDGYFTSNGEDLGEEGRVPPRLDGVGNKLRPLWLSNVLAQARSVRPYLNTRMPQFGDANVGHLAGLFVALDRHVRPLKSVPDAAETQREVGRKLIGTDGLSCIACHRFNRQPAHALQVLDLTTTFERLNEDWFRQFLRDPNQFNPGTRMPAFWPDETRPLPTLLEGDTDRQHAALWTYLADGPGAKFPEGLSRQNVELIVGGDPVVYRGKLWEAGFRAIAVGYPGQLNVAFDAEEVRLSLLWRGRFLNAGPHWGVQGMGRIRPLGTDVVVLPHGSPWAVLTDSNAPWPVESGESGGLKFRGYELDRQQRPTLLYTFRNIRMEDFLAPLADGSPGLRRTVKFTDTPLEHLYFRVATGKLVPTEANTWRLNDTLTLRIHRTFAAILRPNAGESELLVPIKSASVAVPLEMDYVW